MYRRELDGLISSNKVANFMLLRGNDEFQNELYAKELIKYYKAENFMQVYFDEYEFDSCKSFFEPSLFAGKNTLHIKTNKTVPTKEIKTLLQMCKNDNSNSLIYELNDDGARVSNDFIKCFDKNFVRFFKPSTPNEAMALLNKKCEMLQIHSNSAALMRIYQIHNENLSLSAGEIEKFATLGIELNLKNIENMVFGLSEVSFEDLFNKIFSIQDFREDFFRYCQSGSYNDTAFINYLYAMIFRLFKIHSFVKTTGKFDLANILGYTPPLNVSNSLKKYATSFSTKVFEKIFKHLNETEYVLKTKSGIDKNYFLLSSMLELQSILIQACKK